MPEGVVGGVGEGAVEQPATKAAAVRILSTVPEKCVMFVWLPRLGDRDSRLLTVRVTGGWRDETRSRNGQNPKPRKRSNNAARTHLSTARIVGPHVYRFNTNSFTNSANNNT